MTRVADNREPATPGALPRPLTSFVGRDGLLAEVTRLVGDARLLTLTGAGGSGKTRLAIELATRLEDGFADGAYFVAMAAVRDPALVASSIAGGMGLQDARGRPVADHLAAFVAQRQMLLVLDNFEQLLPAANVVAELVAAGPGLRVLVTSRSPLRVSGEQEFPVPPLVVPDDGASPDSVAACESTALFVARATAVRPGFRLDERNAAAVAGIARRLDGLPLALELAAARVKLLPPETILARLEDSLGLLVGGHRDMPDRHQTLRSTIEWSYALLSDAARRLFAVCSAFRGGIALDDLEAVCSSAIELGVPVLDAAQELVDQSLLRLSPESSAARYSTLEMVREFAVEKLAALPEGERVRAAHASVLQTLAAGLERPPIWPDNEFLARLDLEHDNLRAALDWLEGHDARAALRMAGKLTAFWSIHGHFTEGRQRLATLLDSVSDAGSDRVMALNGAAWLAIDQGDGKTATALLSESIQLARDVNDRVGEGTALLNRLRGSVAGPLENRRRDIAELLAMLTDVGDEKGVAAALLFAGLATQFDGDIEGALEQFAECAARSEGLGLHSLRARALQLVGLARVHFGDVAGARVALAEGIPVVVESGDRFGINVGLGALVCLAARSDRPRLALRLVGLLDAYAEINEVVHPAPLRGLVDEFLAPIRVSAGASAVAALYAEGRKISVAQAVTQTLADEPEQAWRSGLGPGLTRRETEVAVLVAQGLPNREIAARLVLSVRTVDVHVDRVLTKLGFHSRTEMAAWAYEHGLMSGNAKPT